jgi:hypothetical protein
MSHNSIYYSTPFRICQGFFQKNFEKIEKSCLVQQATFSIRFLEIILDQFYTRTADLFIVKIDQIFRFIAQGTRTLSLLDDDFRTLCVNLQIIVAVDLKLPS